MSYKELIATIGEYTNSKNEVKKKYQKVGVLLETKFGPSIKIDVIPVNWNGYADVREPFVKDEKKSFDNHGFDNEDNFPI